MDFFTNSLLGKVNGGITGEEINDIQREYEDGETLESKFVQDVGKLELVLQMWTMSAFTSTSWIWGISAGLQAELYCLR
jgi:hypothetical protein